MGYTVRGIDISPAAIDHARSVAKTEGLSATFIQADVREAAFGSGYDAALFIYGEANALKWEEFALVLLRVKEALNPEGVLIMELSPPEAMARRAGSMWETYPSGGLFSDRPYLSLKETFWKPDDQTACARYFVVDVETSRVREYGVSYQAYRRHDLDALMPACGLRLIAEFDSLVGEIGLTNPDWHVIVAERPPD
jgi:SAM-dependent methyltransferase